MDCKPLWPTIHKPWTVSRDGPKLPLWHSAKAKGFAVITKQNIVRLTPGHLNLLNLDFSIKGCEQV